jgi:hypothetical protein
MSRTDDNQAEAEFDAALTNAARQLIEALRSPHTAAVAREIARHAYRIVGNALSDEFKDEPMTDRQAWKLKELCGQFSDVEFPADATKQEASDLIADLIEQLDSRKPAWARR